MPHIPKVPASCVDLDLALVEQTLAKHRANVAATAKELGVPVSDLRRLTWAKPDLLDRCAGRNGSRSRTRRRYLD